MDLAATGLFSTGKADARGALFHSLRMVRRDTSKIGGSEPPEILEEIAAWVNEGGAGDEVRR